MAESKVIPKKRKGRKKKVIAVSLVGVLAAGGIGGALYYKQNSVVKMPEDTKQAQSEYYGAAEPPVRCDESHLSGLTEPPHLFCY